MNPSTSSPQKNRLKQPIIDEWSIREKLALASTVLKSGDQNYNSVTRPLRNFAEPNRPVDWFNQKNCALQYDELLEKVAMPKRKRGERGEETAELLIVRDLTNKRIEELKNLIAVETEKLRDSRREYDIVVGDNPPEELLKEIWQRKLDADKQKIEDEKNYEIYLQEREAKIAAAKRATRAGLLRTPSRPSTASTSASPIIPPQIVVKTETEGSDELRARSSISPSGGNQTSPLLTSLLQSPSSTSASSFHRTGDGSAPSGSPSKATSFFNAPTAGQKTPISSRPTSPNAEGGPSASPTLSKLLEKPITTSSGKTTLESPKKLAELQAQGLELSQDRSEGTQSVVIKTEKDTVDNKTDESMRSEASGEEPKTPLPRRQLRGRSSVATSVATSTPSTPASATVSSSTAPTTRRSGRIKVLRESESDTPVTPNPDKKPSISELDVFASEESTDASGLKLSTTLPSSKAPSIIDSVPNSPASSTMHSEDTDAMREHKRWQKAIFKVFKEAMIHRHAKNFALPVSDKEVKGYSETVKRPMDLTTIRKRLENPNAENGIKTTAEFQRDMMLMFQNALIYNKPDHDVHKEALAMQKDILDLIEDFIESEKEFQKERELVSPPPPASFSSVTPSTTGGKTSSTVSVPSSTPEAASAPKQRRGRTLATTTGNSEDMISRRRSRTSTDTDPGSSSSSSAPLTRTASKKKTVN